MARYPVPAALPASPHESELLIRRSRFLTRAAHTPGPEAARNFIESVRRANADATHNCWAFVAGAPGHTGQVGSSDDGEPHGTAGRPMLQILLHSGVGEIAVVVTRWFGGVKLGTGGLVRAYQDSVRENLSGLVTVEHVPLVSLEIGLSYSYLDGLRRLLPSFEARITHEEYLASASMGLTLPEEHYQDFVKALAGLTNGTAVCAKNDSDS